MSFRLTIALSAALALPAGAASAMDLIGLTSANELVVFSDSSPSKTQTVKVSGLSSTLVGIDVRPANKMLYGVTADSKIYTIDPKSGTATMVSTISTPLTAKRAVVDFNPVADRLRVIGSDGQNLRINVETGAATVDGKIAYGDMDANKGKMPMVTAGAYTNSMAGAKATQLFNIDSTAKTWVLQDPPNDGMLKTQRQSAMTVDGVDIVSDAMGAHWAIVISGKELHKVDLATGKDTKVGAIAANGKTFIDVAVWPAM
jgi:hypothetical protein